MVLKSDKEKVKTLLAETIRLLCKNGLHFKTEFCVEALVGITLDRNEEFFLSIKETVKSDIVSSSDDLQPKPRPDPHRHERLERQEKKVKREPSSYSSCQRKRQSDDVQVQDDNHQAGDLSLGDPQGEQSFWTALTECGNNEQIPKKRRHAEPPDEQSSHSDIRIEIKGEPESDDDIEEIDSPSHDQDQTQTLINMPEQFAFGTAGSSSNPGISGTIPSSALPQQVWDQFPAMGSSDVAGPSGIQSGNTSGLDIDSQQQHPGQQPMMIIKSGHMRLPIRPPYHSKPMKQLKAFGLMSPSSQRFTQVPQPSRRLLTEHDIVQRILLARGQTISPRQIVMSVNGRWKADAITQVMLALSVRGAGTLQKQDTYHKAVFTKKPAEEITAILLTYNISEKMYIQRFNATGVPETNIRKRKISAMPESNE